jgi:hypothetical protein
MTAIDGRIETPGDQLIADGEVARRIGSPEAVRAVAGACAAHNLAVAIVTNAARYPAPPGA